MTDPSDPLADAILAARLCAIDPGLGGMILRGGGELRDGVIAALRDTLPAGAPIRRIPAHIDDERLLGGIDLTATLARGVACRGPVCLRRRMAARWWCRWPSGCPTASPRELPPPGYGCRGNRA